MNNRIREYRPINTLRKYVDSYWFIRNNTKKMIVFPVVPDGCSDIVFYLNNSNKLSGLENTFVTGVMESAELVPIPNKMELFGIRFRPGVLSYFLKADMRELKNRMCSLSEINIELFKILQIDRNARDVDIILGIGNKLEEILLGTITQDGFLEIINELCKYPEIKISEFAKKSGYSVKSLERYFSRRVGLSPKLFSRIMKFQKAHRMISKEGLADLIEVALSSGYFDQSHFNHEYKKLVGFNPNNKIMSILYNT